MKTFNFLRTSIFPNYLRVCLGVVAVLAVVFVLLLPTRN